MNTALRNTTVPSRSLLLFGLIIFATIIASHAGYNQCWDQLWSPTTENKCAQVGACYKYEWFDIWGNPIHGPQYCRDAGPSSQCNDAPQVEGKEVVYIADCIGNSCGTGWSLWAVHDPVYILRKTGNQCS